MMARYMKKMSKKNYSLINNKAKFFAKINKQTQIN